MPLRPTDLSVTTSRFRTLLYCRQQTAKWPYRSFVPINKAKISESHPTGNEQVDRSLSIQGVWHVGYNNRRINFRERRTDDARLLKNLEETRYKR